MKRFLASGRATTVAVLVSVAGLTIALLAAAPHWRGFVAVLVGAWFAAPGVPFARRLFATGERGRLVPIIVGAAWGYGVSTIVLLVLWVAGLRNTTLLLVGSPLVAGAALAPLRLRGALDPPSFCRRDYVALMLLLLVIPITVALPWSRVGAMTSEGRTYRAYFNADFVWHMAVAAEVAHGEVLPKNQFYRGDDLRYYWAADLLPAIEYRAWAQHVRLEDVLLANGLVVNILFVSFLYAFVRHWTTSGAIAAVSTAAAILLGSFEGTERIVALIREGTPLAALKLYNIDGITRWIYGGLPVDDLHRVLFWKPQHAMGYTIGFSALIVVWRSRDVPGLKLMTLAGLSLAIALFFSSFSAIMVGTVVAIVAVWRFLEARRLGAMLIGACGAVLPVAAAVAAILTLHYTDRGESLVVFGLNPQAVRHPYICLTLSFGAMLPAAIVAVFVGFRRGAGRQLVPLLVATAVLFGFYFFVDVRDHQGVYVGWRAGDQLFITFGALVASGLTELWQSPRGTRVATLLVGIVLALASLPTFVIDLYNTQDTTNRRMGPGFRWTLILSPDEMAALDWIQRFTAVDALVQVEPHVRQNDTWAYIPAFAERRMAAGLPISMVPLSKYREASARVRDIYAADDAATAARRAAELGIDYLVIAPPERNAFPYAQTLWDAHSEWFRPVFRNGEMAVYFVERDRSRMLR
ncbi:MAG: hypothetical protein ACM36C_07210 [Acidobacteriota bacterium]